MNREAERGVAFRSVARLFSRVVFDDVPNGAIQSAERLETRSGALCKMQFGARHWYDQHPCDAYVMRLEGQVR